MAKGLTLFAPSDEAFKAPGVPDLSKLTNADVVTVLQYHALADYSPIGTLKSTKGPISTLATNGASKLTKLMLNVTMQSSLGAVQVVMSPELTEGDLIAAAVKLYSKEGRRPLLPTMTPLVSTSITLNSTLKISSLNLLRVISEQEGLPIEELNAGKICDWFLKDKLKREQNLESAVLQWDDSEFQI